MTDPLAQDLARLYMAERRARAEGVRMGRLAKQGPSIGSPARRPLRRRIRIVVLDALRA